MKKQLFPMLWNLKTTTAYWLVFCRLTTPFFAQTNFVQIDTRSSGAADAYFGSDLAVGDVNDDGYEDVLVSAPPAGVIYLYLGGANGLSVNPVAVLPVIPQSNLNIPQPVLLRDVDGDDRADVIVGQPQAGLGLATDAGQAIVFINTGVFPFFTNTPAATLRPNQSQQGGRFGWSIDAGDLNGDGVLDLLIGEPRVDFAFVGAGLANVFYGPVTPGFQTPDQTLQGAQNDDAFGYVVAIANVLGDFRGDAVISSPFFRIYPNNPNFTGRVQVFTGTSGGLSTAPAATITDPCPAGRELGRVMALGDVDDNNFADLVVGSAFMGANCNSFPTSVPNQIYVFLSDGLAVNPNPASTLTVPEFSGNAPVFEPQLIASDVNLDGRADVLAGARAAYIGPSGNAGNVYLFAGQNNPPGVNPAPSQILSEMTPGDYRFFGTSIGTGNIQGTNRVELIIGTPNGSIANPGEIIVFGELLVSIVNISNVSCFGGNNGSATAQVAGGAGTFSYNWSNGQTGQTATNLIAGTYTVTVTSGGSSATAVVTISQPAPITISASSANPTCGAANGSILTNVSGGVPPYGCIWSDNITTCDRTGLPPGSYALLVYDNNNCSVTANFLLFAPPPPIINSSTTDVTCPGGTDGSINWNIATGTPPFTCQWSDNSTTCDTRNNLSGGIYTVTVTDALNCTITETMIIEEPPAFNITYNITNETDNNMNGGIDLTVSGGNNGYTFEWTLNGIYYSNQEDLSNLSAGIYTVVVTDQTDCTATAVITVGMTVDISQPDSEWEITLSPNPAYDITHLQIEPPYFSEAHISLCDMTGNTIFDLPSARENTLPLRLDLSDRPGGTYWLKLQIDGQIIVKKLMLF